MWAKCAIAAVLCAVLTSAGAALVTCTNVNVRALTAECDSRVYSLAKLTGESTNYFFFADGYQYIYLIDIIGVGLPETLNFDGHTCQLIGTRYAAAQLDVDQTCYPLATIPAQTPSTWQLDSDASTLIVTLNGGQWGRTVILRIYCSPRQTFATILNVFEDPYLVYTYRINHCSACATGCYHATI
eukprot:m.589909 g.589909  ORF g.589909 m.589909 type:complete len:185 (-) comp58009_c0_seq19:56-610(-)